MVAGVRGVGGMATRLVCSRTYLSRFRAFSMEVIAMATTLRAAAANPGGSTAASYALLSIYAPIRRGFPAVCTGLGRTFSLVWGMCGFCPLCVEARHRPSPLPLILIVVPPPLPPSAWPVSSCALVFLRAPLVAGSSGVIRSLSPCGLACRLLWGCALSLPRACSVYHPSHLLTGMAWCVDAVRCVVFYGWRDVYCTYKFKLIF
mmetsp:Transcript_5743/g.19033  ORF Transcript_5743/g.19033 Transcript_5743/m.19033 type:complete len:204 (+) Transcript_5743:805-1416(+)